MVKAAHQITRRFARHWGLVEEQVFKKSRRVVGGGGMATVPGGIEQEIEDFP